MNSYALQKDGILVTLLGQLFDDGCPQHGICMSLDISESVRHRVHNSTELVYTPHTNMGCVMIQRWATSGTRLREACCCDVGILRVFF